jgi:hypothetical protein
MSVVDEFVKTLSDGVDMTVERTLDLVLARSRRFTAAEAGSIFVVKDGEDGKVLKACALHNDRIDIPASLFDIPLDRQSIAGYVASSRELLEIDDLYELDQSLPFKFNRTYDDKDGYRSRSMLAFPLKNFDGEVVGVIQLLNHIEGVDDAGNTLYKPFPIKLVDDMSSLMTILGAVVERAEMKTHIARLEEKLKELEN